MPITAAVLTPHPPLIFPEVGKGQEAEIVSTIDSLHAAMRFLAQTKPEAVVIISPHTTCYADYFHISPGEGASGDFSQYRAASLRCHARYDATLRDAITREAAARNLPAGTQGERMPELDHGTMIPLLFLQNHIDLPIVRIGLSGNSPLMHYQMGACIAAAAQNRRIALIASGDLSHRLREDGPYGFMPEGPVLDEQLCSIMRSGQFDALLDIPEELRERAAECGFGSICMLAGAFDGQQVSTHLLSYQGIFGVGYAVATVQPGIADATRNFAAQYEQRARAEVEHRRMQEDAYVQIARLAIEAYIPHNRKPTLPAGLPTEMTDRQAGVFVSLHKHGQLRGCIGTIAPTTPSIAEEILQNAISAATADTRFDPVDASELDALCIKVDVLGEPVPVDSIADLDPKRYGVIVSSGARRGLLLPDLEGVDTAEQQVEIARQKAGLPKGAKLQLERFTVTRHH